MAAETITITIHRNGNQLKATMACAVSPKRMELAGDAGRWIATALASSVYDEVTSFLTDPPKEQP
jgi:hypothetical protein